MSVARQRGDSVIAGTLNSGDAVTMIVRKTGPDTVLAQIGRLVTQAGRDRPELVELTDRIASLFVSAVILVAMVTGLVWWQIEPSRAFEIVLSVLVVTCPCALALATPAAFTVATSRLARDGFLVRRAGALQRLATINHVIFDKTGTLTDNQLRIDTVVSRKDVTHEFALSIAAAMESTSAHPIARAFRAHADAAAMESGVGSIVAVPGGGLQGRIADHDYRIGNLEFACRNDAREAKFPLATENDNRQIYLADECGLMARFDIAENLRAGAESVIGRLAQDGIQTTLASGDQPRPVGVLASRLGLTSWHAAMLPEDKLRLLRNLQSQQQSVAAVGDGINDSPVLAGANVAIAMGSGSAIAQHSADCVWLGEQLQGLDNAFAIGRKTMRIVKQNLIWALTYNLLAIPLAVTGSIQPWMAALGMSLSSLVVMLNALRLGNSDQPAAPESPEPIIAATCGSKPALQ
jgi:Cu2+-exporting ATPase